MRGTVGNLYCTRNFYGDYEGKERYTWSVPNPGKLPIEAGDARSVSKGKQKFLYVLKCGFVLLNTKFVTYMVSLESSCLHI